MVLIMFLTNVLIFVNEKIFTENIYISFTSVVYLLGKALATSKKPYNAIDTGEIENLTNRYKWNLAL